MGQIREQGRDHYNLKKKSKIKKIIYLHFQSIKYEMTKLGKTIWSASTLVSISS
jgi:hypothetical protein